MNSHFLLRIFALCVLALLVAAGSPKHAELHGRSTIKKANKLSCIRSDVSLVKKEVSHPLQFCKFYLSDKRSRSPLPSLSVTALQNACKCIQASPPPEPTIIQGTLPSSKRCSQWTKLLKGEYKHVAEFCNFYLGYPRKRSPVPGLSVSNLLEGCKCATGSTTVASVAKAQQTSTARTLVSTRSSSIATKATSVVSSRIAKVSTGTVASTSRVTLSSKAATVVGFASRISPSPSTTKLSTSVVLSSTTSETGSATRGAPIVSADIATPASSSQVTPWQTSGLSASTVSRSSRSNTPTTRKTYTSITATRGMPTTSSGLPAISSTTHGKLVFTEVELPLDSDVLEVGTLAPLTDPASSSVGMLSHSSSTAYKSITVIRGQALSTKAKSTISSASIAPIQSSIDTSSSSQTQQKTSMRWASMRGKLPVTTSSTQTRDLASTVVFISSPDVSASGGTSSTFAPSPSGGFNPISSRLASSTTSSGATESSGASTRTTQSIDSAVAPYHSASIVQGPTSSALDMSSTSTFSPASRLSGSTIRETGSASNTLRYEETTSGEEPHTSALIATSLESDTPVLPTSNILSMTFPLTATSRVQTLSESSATAAVSLEASSTYTELEYPTYSSGGGYPEWMPIKTSENTAEQQSSSISMSSDKVPDVWISSSTSPRTPDLSQISKLASTSYEDFIYHETSAALATTDSSESNALLLTTHIPSISFDTTFSESTMPSSSRDSSDDYEASRTAVLSSDGAQSSEQTIATSITPHSTVDIVSGFSVTEIKAMSASYTQGELVLSAKTERASTTITTQGSSETPGSSAVTGARSEALHSTSEDWRSSTVSIDSAASVKSGSWELLYSATWNLTTSFLLTAVSPETAFETSSSKSATIKSSSTTESPPDPLTSSGMSSLDHDLTPISDSQHASTTEPPTESTVNSSATLTDSAQTSLGPEATPFTSLAQHNLGYLNVTSQSYYGSTQSSQTILDPDRQAITPSSSSSEGVPYNPASPSLSSTVEETIASAQSTTVADAIVSSRSQEPLVSMFSMASSHTNSSQVTTAIDSLWLNATSSNGTFSVETNSFSLGVSSSTFPASETVSATESSSSESSLSTSIEQSVSSASSDDSFTEGSMLTYYKPASVSASPTLSYDAIALATTSSSTTSDVPAGTSVDGSSYTDSINPETPASSNTDIGPSQTELSTIANAPDPTMTDSKDTDSSVTPFPDSSSDISSMDDRQTPIAASRSAEEPSSSSVSPPEVTETSSSDWSSFETSPTLTGTTEPYPSATPGNVDTDEHFVDVLVEETNSSSSTVEPSTTSMTGEMTIQTIAESTLQSPSFVYISSEARPSIADVDTGSMPSAATSSATFPDDANYATPSSSEARVETATIPSSSTSPTDLDPAQTFSPSSMEITSTFYATSDTTSTPSDTTYSVETEKSSASVASYSSGQISGPAVMISSSSISEPLPTASSLSPSDDLGWTGTSSTLDPYSSDVVAQDLSSSSTSFLESFSVASSSTLQSSISGPMNTASASALESSIFEHAWSTSITQTDSADLTTESTTIPMAESSASVASYLISSSSTQSPSAMSPSDSDYTSMSSLMTTESAEPTTKSLTIPAEESSGSASFTSLGFCQTGAASTLSSYPSASQFCSSFMAPPVVTATTTIYSTQTTGTTSFTTTTQTVQTETSQRVVTQYYSNSTVTTTTCIPASNSGNNFRKRDVPATLAAQTTDLWKRDDARDANTASATCSVAPSVLSGYSCDDVSSACSCYGISTISQTPTSTVTVTSSIQQTDTVAQTTTESITVTVISSSTSYIPQTSTVLYCPRPSSDCNNKSYLFAYYGNEPYGNDVANMDATYTKQMTPTYNSTTNQGVGIYGSEWSSVSLYGSSQMYSDNYFYLSHKGYFFAQVTGYYNFTIKDADDIAYVWMGDAAYSGWTGGPNGGNYVAKARCCWPPENTNTTTYWMEAETYVPFRIVLGQQDGSTSLGLTITAPDGTVILQTGKESDYVVQYSCDGSAPPFPDWGYET
ncbi:hypothetical protein D6D01_05731 [Aureobasidium pullulans]|uniref:PA14 domain-containing protein n=1 Tax=Aureobasidium pullulans TaxID=5580 RepID=A0A4S9L6G8_AURPU|nr:hypothetical protein D6D01_05731 [Aureobasidium pullulans]